MAGKQDGKWRGEIKDVIPAPIDKIFSACETVEGEKNKVGSLRTLEAPLPNGVTVEAKERLTSIDNANYTTTYTIEKINIDWTGYNPKIAATSVENRQTLVNWSFELDPADNQTEEKLLQSQQGLFQAIINLTKGLVAN